MYNQVLLRDFVEEAIAGLSYETGADRLIDPVKYVLSMGGKRLRPVIALMACNLFNDKIDDAVLPATGLEVFHNFTLVHDDIMDEAPLRRNFMTVHNKWNKNQAVLSGDVMAFIANDCFLRAPAGCMPEVFRTFNKAAIEVCAGQQMDMDFENTASVTLEDYIRMIGLKTAALIAASVKIGAIIGGADEKDSSLLYEFGRNLGLAFQLQDDMLDIYGDVKLFGKVSGGDIIAGKKTFLFLKAMEIASGEEKKALAELFAREDINGENKVKKVVEIYDRLNIRIATEDLAGAYIKSALKLLGQTSVAESRKTEMYQLATTLIGREK
jgi:geranylgeranyl diphosphate synthase type II